MIKKVLQSEKVIITINIIFVAIILTQMFLINVPISYSFESKSIYYEGKYYVDLSQKQDVNIIENNTILYIKTDNDKPPLKVLCELNNNFVIFETTDANFIKNASQINEYEIVVNYEKLIACIFKRGGNTSV